MPFASIAHQAFIFLAILCTVVAGTHKCVWVRGALQCHRDSSKQLNVEVRVYDRDGFSIFKAIDPDDLMGVTFTEPDGTFQLDGCGDDFNWLPGLQNLPDPYIRIHHYCNEHGETIELPEFNTFVPESYDLGIIVLDAKKQPNATVVFPLPTNPRHSAGGGGEKVKRPSSVSPAGDSSEEVSIFDVLDSKEKEELQKKTTTKVPVTRPDELNWEMPVELVGSQEEPAEQGGGDASKKSTKERRPNWTKLEEETAAKE